jgi:hypothetical protein
LALNPKKAQKKQNTTFIVAPRFKTRDHKTVVFQPQTPFNRYGKRATSSKFTFPELKIPDNADAN